jgi:hypothetical protein
VRCAVRKGLIVEWSKMEERLETQDDDWFIPLFCEKHEEPGWKEFAQGGRKKIMI